MLTKSPTSKICGVLRKGSLLQNQGENVFLTVRGEHGGGFFSRLTFCGVFVLAEVRIK